MDTTARSVNDLSPLTGADPARTRRLLHRLVHAGLIGQTHDGWRRVDISTPDAAADRLGVSLMAIKKRGPVDRARIEAFGNAADLPTQPAPAAAPPAAEPPRVVDSRSDKPAAGEWPEGTPKTFLIRWGSNPELPALLAEVAALEDRSQQKIAVRALQRGLEILRAEHNA